MNADFWTKLILFGIGFIMGIILMLGYIVKFLADINVLKRKLNRVVAERDDFKTRLIKLESKNTEV